MTFKEYQKKDLELAAKITEYAKDCYDKEAQIAVNNREIQQLEFERKELYALYQSCQEE